MVRIALISHGLQFVKLSNAQSKGCLVDFLEYDSILTDICMIWIWLSHTTGAPYKHFRRLDGIVNTHSPHSLSWFMHTVKKCPGFTECQLRNALCMCNSHEERWFHLKRLFTSMIYRLSISKLL